MPIEELYLAAARAGLLSDAEVGGRTVAVDFRAPDESVLDGLALSADPSIRYPASWLPELAAGDSLQVGRQSYRVRLVRVLGDGTERQALLTLL
ncbi:head-tail joining protein [Eleftheria terrae]|uniref:head-tail joining protein n=1 Tax=Eleftheria terrae TaxID=1597781 RepID=UPI00263BBEB7|nr:hypothetical protein [Eleftheria terrae]WKB50782.1 hypothetical protein N7L95_13240 [Eleftheria terrae]